jgi:hypothetical protein
MNIKFERTMLRRLTAPLPYTRRLRPVRNGLILAGFASLGDGCIMLLTLSIRRAKGCPCS